MIHIVNDIGSYKRMFVLLSIVMSVTIPLQVFASTEPAPLNTNAASDSGDDNRPQITTDGDGIWMAIWHSIDDFGTLETDADIMCSVSINGGVTWSAPSPVNNDAGSDSNEDRNPQLTTNGTGIWIACWQSVNDSDMDDDLDIIYAVSDNDGATWSNPAVLNSNGESDDFGDDDYDPQIATDGAGTWIATWDSFTELNPSTGSDGDILYAVSSDNGDNWSAPKPLNSNATTDSGDDEISQITTDGDGTWIAIWESIDTLGNTIEVDIDILCSISTNNGSAWGTLKILNTNATGDSGLDFDAQLTTDGAGTWIATWSSTDTLSETVGDDADIFYSISSDDGDTWSFPTTLNANAVTDVNEEDFHPQITTDGAGTWVATWWSIPFAEDGDIRYAISSDDGVTWSIVGTLNTNADTDSFDDSLIQLTTDSLGTWIAAWESYDPLNNPDDLGVDDDILYMIWDPVVPVDFVYVDLDASSEGIGTQESPYNNMASGVANVEVGGRMRIVGGVIDVPFTIDKQFTIE